MKSVRAFGIMLCLLILSCGTGRDVGENAVEQDFQAAGGVHPVARWVMACRVPGQGFGCFPGDSAFVTRTGMACEVLSQLGCLDLIEDREELAEWIQSKQNDDGGYREADDYYRGKILPWGTTSALEPTWWALKTLKLLGAEPDNPSLTADFIHARQLPEGAFTSYELGWNSTRTKAMSYSTDWAVSSLRELGEPVPDSAKVVEFLQQLQSPEDGCGGFRLGDLQFTIYVTQAGYHAVRALNLLGAGPLRPQALRNFLFSHHGQETDGGFECGHGDQWNNFDHYSRAIDTYSAIRTLVLLGTPLSDDDSSRASKPAGDCARWLCSLQNNDGGFARFGVTEQTPVPSPSEMAATWYAVMALGELGRQIPGPANSVEPVNEVQSHKLKYLYPTIKGDDPVDVWAYRRIAQPIHDYYLRQTGSRIAAVGWLSKWVRCAVAPMNAAFCTGGRSLLMHGFGQCAQMSLMLQQLAISVDYPGRYTRTYSCVGGDVNCEIRIREEGWDKAHWCLFIPFSNEYMDPNVPTPEGKCNGWSGLDCLTFQKLKRRQLNFQSTSKLGDHCFSTLYIETIDYENGKWGEEVTFDTTFTYRSELVKKFYPGESW